MSGVVDTSVSTIASRLPNAPSNKARVGGERQPQVELRPVERSAGEEDDDRADDEREQDRE